MRAVAKGGVIDVVIIGAFPLPGELPRGGVETATQNLVNALENEHMLRLSIVVPRADIRTDLSSGNVRYMALPRNPLLRRVALLRRIKRDPQVQSSDLVHVQGDTSVASFLTRLGKRTVLTAHGVAERDIRLDGRKFAQLRSFGIGVLERRARSNVRNVIAISDVTREVFSSESVLICDIPNAINPLFFTDEEYDSLTLSTDLIFAGRIVPLKNVIGLIRAVGNLSQEFPGVKLVIAGSGSRSYREICSDEILAKGIQQKVRFVGDLSSAELQAYFKTARCLVLPSFQENAPMVVAEAMASGLEIIATDVGGVRQMLQGYEAATLVPLNDQSALEVAIRDVLKCNNYRGLSRSLAISEGPVAYRYSPAVVAESTLDFYRKVLDR